MKYTIWLAVLTLICVASSVVSLDIVCPKCVNHCPVQACDCTDCYGQVLTRPPGPPIPPRPKGCEPCFNACPLYVIHCDTPPKACTDDQLDTYVLQCDECIPQAGCQQIGCDCLDADGNTLMPPKNDPQPPRQANCPKCHPKCPISNIRCAAPTQCTPKQLDTYVIRCPECVSQAGCKQAGCDCKDCDGNVLTSPTNPPQPPRPDGCPKCSTTCYQSRVYCPETPDDCSDKQLAVYVPKCPPCVNDCPVPGCDCTDCEGNLLTPPPKPAQPPRPKNCPACVFVCPRILVKCPAPSKLCSDTQLDTYVPKCPVCIDTCPKPECDCVDSAGNTWTQRPPPEQPPRPKTCPACVFECPSYLIDCIYPPGQCTADQLDRYILKCPDCVSQAGCKQNGCDCKDCDGNLWTSKTNPPQPPRPDGCPKCSTVCIQTKILCLPPGQCTDHQLAIYEPKCPPCPGCPFNGCDCSDSDGNVWSPLPRPPQPPRPKICPVCLPLPCPLIRCADPPQECTDDQFDRYALKCPDCVPQAGCKQRGCDCVDLDGEIWTSKTNPPQPPRQAACPKCSTACTSYPCQQQLQPCTDTQLANYEPQCPSCLNSCPTPGCDCTDSDGNVWIPAPRPPQPPRPKNCPTCECPQIKIRCPDPSQQCSDDQLDRYVRKCPDCVSQAGCKQNGCDCTDCDGNVWTSKTNPPQPPRPDGCPKCSTVCIQTKILCLPPRQCTDHQLAIYEPKCPPCPGCPFNGCDCTDCDGNVWSPLPRPPQPPRPKICPVCFALPCAPVYCADPPQECTDEQYDLNALKCPDCVPQAGCKQNGCDCKDCDGNVWTSKTNPPQPPRPDGCPKCSTVCIQTKILCPKLPGDCTDTQLAIYEPKCPPCVNNCPVHGCDCTDRDGNVWTPKPKPPQPPRPKNCPACVFACPLYLIKCPDVSQQCTATQLDTYVPQCPPCLINCAGPGCDCTDCDGNLLTPPPRKPQPPRPKICPACIIPFCPVNLHICPAPSEQCTDTQLDTYVPKCPPCVNTCPKPGCDCTDCDGTVWTPQPPVIQPPRPKNCPACVFHCPLILADCPAPSQQCTDTQLDTYVPKCPDCIPQAGCKQIGCDCKDCNGDILTPPNNPQNPPRPPGCDACNTVCSDDKIYCFALNNCTARELATYVHVCPPCVPQAGCQQLGCECYDRNGYSYVPRYNPPQPRRPVGCEKCPQNCIIPFVPCGKPTLCTKEQLKKYMRNPDDDDYDQCEGETTATATATAYAHSG